MQNEDYRTIGQMLATIIIHDGEHPRIFSPAICSYITKGLEFCQPGIEEVPDAIVRDSLKKVVQYRINSLSRKLLQCFYPLSASNMVIQAHCPLPTCQSQGAYGRIAA
jgi:hypothetical protein